MAGYLRSCSVAQKQLTCTASLDRVVNDCEWLASIDGHVKRVDHEFFAHMISHGPADDASTAFIENHGKVQETAPRRNVCDIGDPQLIRSVGRKATLHEIRCRLCVTIADSRNRRLAARSLADAANAHQTCHAFAADADAFINEFSVYSRTPVRRSRSTRDRFNPIAQNNVVLSMLRRRTNHPRVETACRNPEDAAHRVNRIHGLVRSHESEDRFGSILSRANQAVVSSTGQRNRDQIRCRKVVHGASRTTRLIVWAEAGVHARWAATPSPSDGIG